MKIRNLLAFEVYLPYAGKKRGLPVKAGELSIDLPTDRYYDPLLQRDWRCRKIEILLSETDKIVLGPVTKQFRTEPVDVADAEQPQPIEAPPPEAEPMVVVPMSEPVAIVVDPASGEQAEVPPAPAAEKPKRKRLGKRTDPDSAPAAAINQRTDVIRMNKLALELGASPKAILAQMAKMGMEVKGRGYMMNVPLADVEKLRPHFKGPFTGSPALDPDGGVDRRGQKVVRLHEVPTAPGMPATTASPGAPSLEDLQRANYRLSIGQPKYGSTSSPNGVRIELPGANPPAGISGGMLGSTLSSGTPQAQRAQAAADAAALAHAQGGAQ